MLTIGCGTDPVPACEVDDYRVYADFGYYAGALRMTEALSDDLISVPITSDTGRNIGVHRVCRWAYAPVNQNRVSSYFPGRSRIFRRMDMHSVQTLLEGSLRHQSNKQSTP